MRMIHRWSGLTLERRLLTLSTLVFHLTAFLLLTQRGGQCEMIGSPEPIVAMIGEDVILPCHLDRCTNVVSMTLEWARLDLSPRFVHVRRDGKEILLDQNPAFVGRASSSAEKMQHGDLSLKLSKVRVSDEGMYRCQIPGMGSLEVLLFVGAVSPLVVRMGDISNSGLDLQCESSGWYPEPEVLWLDGEGNFLSAESAETVKGPDDLYSVSSRVTVERSNNINIICRVQQKRIRISQTREKDVQILDVYSGLSNSAPGVGVVIAVALLMLSAVFFVLWRVRQRRGDKNPSDEESKKVEEETPLRETQENKVEEKPSREMRKEEEEEKENKTMSEVLSFLEEQRRELEHRRYEEKKLLDEVEIDLKENRQCQEVSEKKWFNSSKVESLKQIKCELDKRKTVLKNSLESTEYTLKRTSDIILKTQFAEKTSVENETDDLKPDKETEIPQDQVKSKVLEREERKQK